MEKEALIEIIRKILKVDTDLRFLLKLNKDELETLAAQIRHSVDYGDRRFNLRAEKTY